MFKLHHFLAFMVKGFFLILTFLAIGDVHAAASANHLIFILDASGSMDMPMENQTRMKIVKTALTELIEILPEQTNVGLMVYGRNRKGDCNDVEEMVALAPLDKKIFTTKIQNIRPEGMTPIALSIQKSLEKFDARKDGNTIILISDGQDTCTGDPCPLVKAMKEKGIKFVIHVISIGAAQEEENQLACIANAGEGLYISSKNIRELKLGLIRTTGLSEKLAESYLSPTADALSETVSEKEAAPFQPLTSEQIEASAPASVQIKETTATVKVASARIRKSPSLEAGIVFNLKKGDNVSVTETKEDWYHIRLKNGKTGWGHGSLFIEKIGDLQPEKKEDTEKLSLNPEAEIAEQQGKSPEQAKQESEIVKTSEGEKSASEPAPAEAKKDAGKKVTLTLETGIIRERPSIYANIKSMMKKGDTVTIVAEKDDKWYQIQMDDGSTGWVHRRLFEPAKDQIQDQTADTSVQTAKAENKIEKSKVIKTSGKPRLIQDIRVETSSDNEEKVIFTLNEPFAPAKTFFLNEGDDSKVICDFSNTELADGVNSSVNVNGKLIQRIRTGLHEKPALKLRVVMDMVSNKKYQLQHIQLKNEKRYVLIFKAE